VVGTDHELGGDRGAVRAGPKVGDVALDPAGAFEMLLELALIRASALLSSQFRSTFLRSARRSAQHPDEKLGLGTSQVFEAAKFDSAGDVGHIWLAVRAPGEIAGLFRLARAGPARAVANQEPLVEDLQQEGGQGQVKLAIRGEAAVIVMVAGGEAGGWRRGTRRPGSGRCGGSRTARRFR